MRKLDPQLEFLAEGGATALSDLGSEAVMGRFGMEAAMPAEEGGRRGARARAAATPVVTVLVECSGATEPLEAAGLTVRGIAGDVVTGTIALGNLEKLSEVPDVRRVEAARAMHPELDLSVVEARADVVHVGPPGRRGAGVIVGIVDSGCDYTHPSFRRADGTSRILLIWDQSLTPAPGEASPAGFGYGVEYGNVQINAALASVNPFALVRHQDSFAPQHGTHVTGIAAGDGSAPGQGRPGGTFVGVAPEADIIIVANASNGAEGLGTSANTLDAVNYIFEQARTRSQPCAINMSLGDNMGPHDGTSLLERGLDNLLGGPGRAFVKSAGNAGADRIHAEGNVASGTTVDLRFNQPAGDASPNQIDLWYEGADTFRVTVIDPAGATAGPVTVGVATTVTLPGGNAVRIDHRDNDPFNGDKRVFMTFTPGAAGQMRAGNWVIRLVGVSSPSGGRFDAWIQRGAAVPTFLAPHESQGRTISTPGTALEVITAANYITRGAGIGSLASSSSRGPTRDNRAAPTVAAPGSTIVSAAGHFPTGGDPYRGLSGTSMAAPHITGAIALMFQKNPDRTQAQIKACLESSARADGFTGPVPNTAWGAGKLDVAAAVDCVPTPGLVGPLRSVVLPCPSVVQVACRSVATPCISVPRVNCPSVIQTTCVSIPVQTCGTVSVPRLTCPSVIQVSCRSQIATTCGGPSVPRLTCPSVIQVSCRSEIATTCGGPSVPRQTCPSVIQVTCQSQLLVTCGAPSVPVATCPVQSVTGPCASLVCPSVIDGCPSVFGCVTVVVNPDPVVNPVVVGPGLGLDPRGVAIDPGAFGGFGQGAEAEAAPPPPSGYFDYDDSWFD